MIQQQFDIAHSCSGQRGYDLQLIVLVLLLQVISHIHSKCGIPATMERDIVPVNKDGRFIIDRAKIEQNSVASPFLRYLESSPVPRVDGLGSLDARKPTLQAERDQDLVRQRAVKRWVTELVQARRIRVGPQTVQATPLRAGELGSGILWPGVCAYIVRPVGV